MDITTFQQEELPNQQDLIIKALFILVFKQDRVNTNFYLKINPDADRLIYLYNILKDSKYLFISMINPVEYTLIAKQIVKPINRLSLDSDFDKVDSNLLFTYLNQQELISTTMSLN